MQAPHATVSVPSTPAKSVPANTEASCSAAPPADSEARALIDQYCESCHSPNGSASDADFRSATAIRVRRSNIEAKLRLYAMPPSDAPQPSDDERAALRCWVRNSDRREPGVN